MKVKDLKDEPYTKCKGCGKLVPVTLYCMMCKHPILAGLKKK